MYKELIDDTEIIKPYADQENNNEKTFRGVI